MKRKILAILLATLICMSMTACTNSGANTSSGNGSNISTQSKAEIPNLVGEWKQVNSNSEDSFQTATVTGDVIEVYWVTTSTDTKSLYWAGSFTAPTTADEPYSWDSKNDTEKTGSALLASTDSTKTFTYKDGQISYGVTALGTTQTVKLEKQ